jgi:hypothetical protein
MIEMKGQRDKVPDWKRDKSGKYVPTTNRGAVQFLVAFAIFWAIVALVVILAAID